MEPSFGRFVPSPSRDIHATTRTTDRDSIGGGMQRTATRPATTRVRTARRRHYVMADPAHLDVVYAINPWMDPTAPFDRERAAAQWRGLHEALVALGHRVDVLPATPGLPDLVFAANGAVVVGRTALLSRFRFPQRAREAAVHERHLVASGRRVVTATSPIEGEGDVLLADGTLLAGHGFRTSRAAHRRLAATFDLPVLDLELVDPRFYHLDTAVGVAAADVLVWHPPAIAPADAQRFRARFPTAVEVDEHDALLLGCNLLGDGRHVVVPAGVDRLARDLAARGLTVVEVPMDELLLAGGGPKCCTAEWH